MCATAVKSGRLLIVEDEPILRDSLSVLLEIEGFEVHGASHGAAALENLHEKPLPDAMVVDLMMPVMDGWEFIEKCHEDPHLASVPIVVLSGAEKGPAPAANVVMKKPVDFDDLLKALRNLTAEAAGGADTAPSR